MVQSKRNKQRALGRANLFFLALKQVVGGGVIALPAVAYAETGVSITLAFPLATLLMTISELPLLLLSRRIGSEGSIFAWPARFLSPRAGFLSLWMHLGCHVSLALYATTAAETLRAFWPALPTGGTALALLLFAWTLNFGSNRLIARFVLLATSILIASLAIFISVALPAFSLTSGPFLKGGIGGFESATALLCFGAGGASIILELGRDVVAPKRNIWRVGLAANGATALLYACVAAATCGAIALTSATGQPLSIIAGKLLSPFGAQVFAIATGLIGMLGMMTVNLLWGGRAVVVAARSGHLPAIFGHRSASTDAPFISTGLLVLLGILPILLGFDVARVARIALVGAWTSTLISIVAAAAYAFRRRQRAGNPMLMVASVAGFAIQGWLLVTLLRSITLADLSLPLVWMGFGVLVMLTWVGMVRRA